MPQHQLELLETKEDQAKDNKLITNETYRQEVINERRNQIPGEDDKQIKDSMKQDLKRWTVASNNAQVEHLSKINKVCCINISNQWRMKSQFKVAFGILFTTIFLTLISITSYNILKINEIMLKSQNQLFISQAQKNLQTISKKFGQLVTTHFNAIKQDTIHFQKIYRIVSETKNSNKDFLDTPYSSLNRTQFQQGFYYTWVCYSEFSNQSETIEEILDDKFFTQSIQHFNQIHPMIVSQNYTYLPSYQFTSFYTVRQFVYLYPCIQLPINFKPQERGWYIETKLIDQEYRMINKIFASFHMAKPIYNNITNTTTVSITKTLLDRKGTFKGISSSAIDISRFSQLFHMQLTQFTALLVNPDGLLLISPYPVDGNNMGLYFQNIMITGFNEEDWLQVTNLAKKQQITHNCSFPYLNKVKNILCRWNKLHLRSELIFATYYKNLDYYIVILLDEQLFLQELYIQQQQYEDQLINTNIIFFCTICGLFILLLLCSSLIISIIFRPMHNITTYCKQIIDKNHLKIIVPKWKQIKINNIITKGQFHGLTLSFYKLIQRFTKLRKQRNQFCKREEQINYPQQDTQQLKLKKQMKQLVDMNEDIDSVIKWKGSAQIQFMDKYQPRQISTTPKEVSQKNNQRMQKKVFHKLVQEIQLRLSKFKYPKKDTILKLIFYYYKKQ